LIPLGDTARSRSFPIVNWLIIIVTVAVFILVESRLTPRRLDQLILTYGTVPARLVAGDPAAILTLLTSMFLHGGWLHLISNVWALFIFGDNVEDRLGALRYLTFYLLCGSVAGVVQVAATPTSQAPAIGASGAIAGVMAAYLVLLPRARVVALVPLFFFLPWLVEIPAIIFIGFWFLIQVFSGVQTLDSVALEGGIAYWAHIGGFVCGLLLVKLFARRVVHS
jgi:membrane associated rhomboid family serine protease